MPANDMVFNSAFKGLIVGIKCSRVPQTEGPVLTDW